MSEETETKAVGVGVIGCGARIQKIFTNIHSKHPEIQVRALCDPHPESIDNYRAAFNPNARIYENYKDLVADPEIDWVMIGSWNCFHCDHAVAALEAGKHVFCEKPLAVSLEQCLKMREAWKRSGRLFSLGFVLRYSPFYQKVSELIENGAVGKIISFEFNETIDFNLATLIHGGWRRSRENAGSFILEKCCHDLDLANWFIESIPSRVASFGGLDIFRPENNYLVDRLGHDRDGRRAYTVKPGVYANRIDDPFTRDQSIVDNQVVILEYANGVRGTFHTNCQAGILERRFYILGTEGTIRADIISGRLETQRVGFNKPREVIEFPISGGHYGSDLFLAASLAQSIHHQSQPMAGIEEGIKSAVTAFAIDQALDEKRIVELTSLWDKVGISCC